MNDASPVPGPEAVRRFASTRWSIVMAAGQRDSPESEAALATLCRQYWYPLYAYARRRLPDAEDARDLTQEFFATLLEKDYLRQADQQRGRFRSFLLTAFQHFLAKEHERAHALKRGGGRRVLSLDFDGGEQRYHREPSHETTPEALYERGWALMLLEQGLTRLREEYAGLGKQQLFDCLKGTLTAGETPRPYAELAAELGMSAEALKVAVHRLRRRYGELVRSEIAHTVTTTGEIEDEVRNLFAAVRAKKS
ncbi:MAG TPA: sigma-70 family RNA polymerase sigma factor [Gemmataceae bacterium]|nr:sigma-70 family RNA polymerase sigma factor [Gemmataceae bacterium]